MDVNVYVTVIADNVREFNLTVNEAEWEGIRKFRDAYNDPSVGTFDGKYVAGVIITSDKEQRELAAADAELARLHNESKPAPVKKKAPKEPTAFEIAYRKAMEKKS